MIFFYKAFVYKLYIMPLFFFFFVQVVQISTLLDKIKFVIVAVV